MAAHDAVLLAPAEPDAEPHRVPELGQERQGLGVLLGPSQQIVAGHEALGSRGQATVALETGPDERLVRQVVTREEPGDALEERRLRERPGRREEAEHGPLDPVGQGQRRGLAIRPIGQPPASRLDLDEAALGRSAELLPDERQQPLDVAGGDILVAGAARPQLRLCDGRRSEVLGRDAAAPSAAAPVRPAAFCGCRMTSARGVVGARPGAFARRSVVRAPAMSRRRRAAGPTRISPSRRSCGLACRALEDLDGGLTDRPRGLGGRESPQRPGREQLTGTRSSRWPAQSAPGRRGWSSARWQRGAGRDELDDGGLLAWLREPCRDEAVAGSDAAQHGGDDRLLATRLAQEDGPAVPRQHRLGRPERAGEGRRLPSPGDACGRRREGRRAAAGSPPRVRAPNRREEGEGQARSGDAAVAAGR
jgi:hypothetical protein